MAGCWTNAFTISDDDVILRLKGCLYPQGSSIYYVRVLRGRGSAKIVLLGRGFLSIVRTNVRVFFSAILSFLDLIFYLSFQQNMMV